MMKADTLISTDAFRAYKAEISDELSRILQFWKTQTLDQRGGFVGKMDYSGRVDPNAPKGAILNARILWTFSAAYKHTRDREQLLLAKRAYDYLTASIPIQHYSLKPYTRRLIFCYSFSNC